MPKNVAPSSNRNSEPEPRSPTWFCRYGWKHFRFPSRVKSFEGQEKVLDRNGAQKVRRLRWWSWSDNGCGSEKIDSQQLDLYTRAKRWALVPVLFDQPPATWLMRPCSLQRPHLAAGVFNLVDTGTHCGGGHGGSRALENAPRCCISGYERMTQKIRRPGSAWHGNI